MTLSGPTKKKKVVIISSHLLFPPFSTLVMPSPFSSNYVWLFLSRIYIMKIEICEVVFAWLQYEGKQTISGFQCPIVKEVLSEGSKGSMHFEVLQEVLKDI